MPTEPEIPSLQLELVIHRDGVEQAVSPFTIKPSGELIIREDMSYDQYVDGLRAWKTIKGTIKMGFAEYVTWGRLKFGAEKISSELTQLHFDMGDIKTTLAISSVPPEIRHPNLEPEHYVVLGQAEITKAQQSKWAKTASQQQLTPNQLRASIEAGEVVSSATASSRNHGVITIHGIQGEFNLWLTRVGGVQGLRKLIQKPEERDLIVPVLKAMHEVYMALIKPAKARKAKKRK